MATGSFTLDIEEANGNDIVSKTSFEGILSLAGTVATMEISPIEEPTATGILSLDYEGDGVADMTIPAEENGVVSPDVVPPTTTATTTGTLGTNGWYLSDVSIAFNATDTESGVKDTFYSLNSGATWATTTPLVISTEGTTTMQYYSTDNDGNIEATSTLIVKIDKIAPEAKISVDPTTKDLKIEGVDMNPTTVAKDGNVYTITDLAGHTAKLFFQKTFAGKMLTFAKLTGVQYDSAPKIILPSSSFLYIWNPALISQTITVKKDFLIEAVYNKKKDQTTVLVKEKGRQIRKEVFTGLRIVKLTTVQGTVGYEI
ncbi:MAG: hypothetical protein WC878_07585 [Candidatus Paceibacterota bacterium]|jgi:hypothetical protein